MVLNFLEPKAAAAFIRTAFADQPDRLRHILTVAERVRQSAGEIAARHPAEAIDETLAYCAALVHDIGYLPHAGETDFHPLDGYRFLCARGAEPLARRIVRHSCAPEEAALRGLQLPEGIEDLAADLVTCWDMRVKQGGEVVSYEARLEDILRRYGAESIVGRANWLARPRIQRIMDRIDRLVQGPPGGCAAGG